MYMTAVQVCFLEDWLVIQGRCQGYGPHMYVYIDRHTSICVWKEFCALVTSPAFSNITALSLSILQQRSQPPPKSFFFHRNPFLPFRRIHRRRCLLLYALLSYPMSKAKQMKLQQAASTRRQHLLRTHSSASASARIGEVVGGTVAECAVVCCCCPCGILNLLVLAFYKVPAGLCRRALRNRRRRKLIGKGLLPQRMRRCKCDCEEVEIPVHPIGSEDAFSDIVWQKSEELDEEAMQLEKEMWDIFYSTGFWRSCSTRERLQDPIPSVNSTDSLLHLTSSQPDSCR